MTAPKRESGRTQRPIYVANGDLEAEQVRSFLAANGIKTIELGDSFRKLFDISEGQGGAVEIFVDPVDEPLAKALLRSADAGEFRLPDDEEATGPPR